MLIDVIIDYYRIIVYFIFVADISLTHVLIQCGHFAIAR